MDPLGLSCKEGTADILIHEDNNQLHFVVRVNMGMIASSSNSKVVRELEAHQVLLMMIFSMHVRNGT